MTIRANKTGGAEAARNRMLKRHGLNVQEITPAKQGESKIEKAVKPIRKRLQKRQAARQDGGSGSGSNWQRQRIRTTRAGIKGHTYKVCPDCGSHLDPGERCDCRS